MNTLAFRWISARDATWARREGLSGDGNHLTSVIVLEDRDGNVIERNERRFTRNAENCLDHDREDLFRECQRRTTPRD